MRYTTKVTLSSQATLGIFGRVWTSDVIGDHRVSFTMHLALRFNLSCGVTSCHSCGVMSATAQLCSPTISPKVVRDFLNPCIIHHQLILCLQLHNCAVLRSLLKLYAIFVIPALPNSLWCSSIDPLSATAQLCSRTISPKVVRDFRNPSFA